MSPLIKKAIEQGTVSFDTLGGGTNLSYKTSLWKNLLCDVFAFLDNDVTGIKAYEEANEKGLLTLSQVTFAVYPGFKESEIEDLLNPVVYNDEIINKFGVNLLSSSNFRNNKYKWSTRVKNSFRENSKTWNDKIETQVKTIISTIIEKEGRNGLQKNNSTIKSLISSLENYLMKTKTFANIKNPTL